MGARFRCGDDVALRANKLRTLAVLAEENSRIERNDFLRQTKEPKLCAAVSRMERIYSLNDSTSELSLSLSLSLSADAVSLGCWVYIDGNSLM